MSEATAAEVIAGRPYRATQELDRVRSMGAVAKEWRVLNAYTVRSGVFSAEFTVRVNTVSRARPGGA